MRDRNSATLPSEIAVDGETSADPGPQADGTPDGTANDEPPSSAYLARLAFQAKERRARQRSADQGEANR